MSETNPNHDRPKVHNEPISLLLPVFNQAAGLEPIVESWFRAQPKLNRQLEFIVIDDGSTDETRSIAEKLAARHSEMRLLRHDTRRGFGACLRTALEVAQHPLVFYTSCDYPYQPGDIVKLLEVIDSVDVVSGCRTEPVPEWLRRLGQARRVVMRVVFGLPTEPRPGWRGWAAWRQGTRWRWLFGLRMWDVPSAFKLYRRTTLDRIPIQSNGDFVHAELLAKANFLGCLMAEVPIGRLGGTFKGVPESPVEADRDDARRVFRKPEFAAPATKS